MMKISNTIVAVLQLMNEMSAIAANNFKANLDFIFLHPWFTIKISGS